MLLPSIIFSLLLILPASASPKGRLKVKYRVKPGGDKVMVKTMSDEGLAEKDNVEEVLTNEVDGDALMLEARDLLMASTPDSYKQTVTTIVGQLQRAARSQDLSVTNWFHFNNYNNISPAPWATSSLTWWRRWWPSRLVASSHALLESPLLAVPDHLWRLSLGKLLELEFLSNPPKIVFCPCHNDGISVSRNNL